MTFISELVKQYLLPGSTSFLLIGLLIGLILLYAGDRASKWGRRWIAALIIGYILLSTSVVSNSLIRLLSVGFESIDETALPADIDGIVILGGGGTTYLSGEAQISVLSGASTLRAIEGARIYDLTEDPLVIVSGGTNERAGLLEAESERMRPLLTELGIPESQIILDDNSHNTYDHTVNIPPMLEEHGIERFVLVTSPSHMRRAYLSFVKAGMHPIPSIAEETSAARPIGKSILIFNKDALSLSTTFFRELMGLGYYALQGWL